MAGHRGAFCAAASPCDAARRFAKILHKVVAVEKYSDVGCPDDTPRQPNACRRTKPIGRQRHKRVQRGRQVPIRHSSSEGRESNWKTTRSNELPLLLAVPRAAQLLGISRASAYRLAASGELPVRRLGGRVYVVTAGLRELSS